MALPRVSIIIPVKSGSSAGKAIASIKNANYPGELLEIIIVEGNHPARQRNDGCKVARGEILYFLDNDSQIKQDALFVLARKFKHAKNAVIGGPSITSYEQGNYFGSLIGFVLGTQFGALRMRYRYSLRNKPKITTEYHLIGANLAMRASIFKKTSGFDESFYPNEETEFLRRLQSSGYALTYTRKLVVYRAHRRNLRQLLQQFYGYGRGRMMQIVKFPRVEDVLFGIPPLFGLYIFSLLFFHSVYYLLPLFLYVILCFLTSLKAALKYKRGDLLITMPLIFPVIHLSYAAGIVMQAKKTVFSHSPSHASSSFQIKIAKVKLFNKSFHSFVD